MFLVIFTKEPPWQVPDISKPKQSNSVRSFELRGKGHLSNRLIHYRKSTEKLWALLSGNYFPVVHMVSALAP